MNQTLNMEAVIAQAAQNYEHFKTILTNLLNTDNETRSQAEGIYDSLPVASKFSFLQQTVLDNNVTVELCDLASVLLRRLITSDFEEVFLKLPDLEQAEIKKRLLTRVQTQTNHNLRKKICDVTAELARNCLDEKGGNKWPEFLEYLFMSVQVPDPQTREIALLMFAAVPGICGSLQDRYLRNILQMLCQNLNDAQNPQVRLVAVKATTAFLLANEKEVNVQKEFAPSIAYILEFLNAVMDSQNDQLDEILRHLVDLAETCPITFKSQIDLLFNLCLKGISTPGYMETCIHLSLEVLVTICESAAPMVKKLAGKHLPALINVILRLMTGIEDDPNWLLVDDDCAEEDNDSTPVVAEASLDRLACALGGKTILPIIFNQLPLLLNSGNWKERYAGLMAVSAIGEGCHKQMVSHLGQVVDGILPFLMDQEPRVQYAGCNALGQLSSDFAPGFQKKYHDKILPILLPLLVTSMHSRVQAHAGAALVNFFEDCPKNVLVPYIPRIVESIEVVLNSKLKELVEKGTKIVLEQAVVTLASLADSAQEKFCDFYEKFMPCLKFIIKNANQPDLRLLRGKTIECVSLIGLAVGKEKFHKDAEEVMKMLLESNCPILADDDPQLSYMIAAWARICKILGKEFQPYLKFVMEPVLKAAAIKPEIAVLDSDDMKVVGNDDDWEFVNLGEKHNFGIRTAGLDEKATACQMLVWYAKELKEGFAEYVKHTVDIMVPMLKFYFHDAVRIAAAEILPHLLESAKASGDINGMLNEWRGNILPSLLGALESEPEVEVLCEHMAAFSQCVEILGVNSLQGADIDRLLGILDKNLENHFQSSNEREKKRKEEEIDEVLEDTLQKEDDEDVYLLSKVSEVVCSLFAVYKTSFLELFDKITPRFETLLESNRPWDRQWGLCVFADLIECCGPACVKYNHVFMMPLHDSLKDNLADSRRDSIADLRQTASYTVGVLAQYGGPSYDAIVVNEFVPLLLQIINQRESRNEENIRCTENAISAITKIMKFNSQLTNKGELFSQWLSWLPVWEDEEENRFIYSYLCSEIVEFSNPFILGNENCNLIKILVILAEAISREAVEMSSEVGQQIVFLVHKILENDTMKEWVTKNLDQRLQDALVSALRQKQQ